MTANRCMLTLAETCLVIEKKPKKEDEKEKS